MRSSPRCPAYLARRGHVFAIDNNSWRGIHLVTVADYTGQAVQHCFYAERVPGVRELCLVDARQLIGHVEDLLLGQRLRPFTPDDIAYRVQNRGLVGFTFAHCLQCQEQMSFGIVGALVWQVDAFEDDVVSLLLHPLFQSRFQCVAERAVIHEEFDDFNLSPGSLARLWRRQHCVLGTWLRVIRRCKCGSSHQAGGDNGKTQDAHKTPR